MVHSYYIISFYNKVLCLVDMQAFYLYKIKFSLRSQQVDRHKLCNVSASKTSILFCTNIFVTLKLCPVRDCTDKCACFKAAFVA